MFDLDNLAKAVGDIDDSMLTQVQIARFDPNCFASASDEESIIACCGSKSRFPNPAVFWLLALRADDWSYREGYFGRYALLGLCRNISTEEYHQIIEERTHDLRRDLPAFLNRDRNVLSAQLMYNDWYDVALIGELDSEFVTFHWETTA